VNEINKIERLMNTIIILKAHPGIQVESLAEIFNTSIRTIYRDFKSLNFAGLPVYSSTGPHGGYYVGEQCFLSPLRFTYEEAASLFLAGSFLLQQKGCPYQKNIHLALLKIENLLEKDNKRYIQEVKDKISFNVQKLKDYEEYSETFDLLNKAMLEKRKINLKYYTISRDKLTIRTINPYHLMFRQGVWYLIAFCHWRKKTKIFRVDRIKEITISNDTFETPSDFSLSAYMGKSWQVVRGKDQTIKVKIYPPISRWVKEEIRHSTQKIEELSDGSIIFSAEVSGIIEIKKWILGMGSSAEVLSPQTLRKEIQEEIEGIKRRYN
jgi:predicted DNA-binding transcriptional regulator YafY